MTLPYRIIACDLDGTLIGRDHKTNPRDLDALHRARAAGLHIALATGRNTLESAGVISALDLTGLGVFVNGAMVSDMATGRTTQTQRLSLPLAEEMMALFVEHGHAVLLLAEDPATRLPVYYITDDAPAHRGTREWLLANRLHSLPWSAAPASHRNDLVRVGAVVDVPHAKIIVPTLTTKIESRAESHSIYSPYYDCQIVEVFAHGVSKWSGLLHLAHAMHIPPTAIVTIGDDTNDISMLRGASLSFAMGNAHPDIQATAKRITAAQKDCGVAQAIDALFTDTF